MEPSTPQMSRESVEQGFVVRTQSFEGPLELILDLIEKRKLLVNEVSLAQVTDDYIQYVKNGEHFPMEEAAHFINVAATLLLIKSKSLLPDLELSSAEEEDVDDLTKRLERYERARAAARLLARIFGTRVLVARGDQEPDVVFAPSRDLATDTLYRAIVAALASKEREAPLAEVRVRPMITIEEMMDTLKTRVERAMTLSFREFAGSRGERVEIIVSFLALLELVKQGAVETTQYGHFNDIQIHTTGTGVPRYG